MRFLGVLVLGTGLWAADAPPAAPLQGVLLERDPQTASGQFSLRLPDNEVLRFRFDSRTSVQRDRQSIEVARLVPGEKLEVVSVPVPGFSLRQARSIEVIGPAPAPPPAPPRRASALSRSRSANRLAEERLLPTGNLTYAGVVARLTRDRIVLHGRDGREHALLLRTDTRYLLNGAIVDAATLKLNTPVFVRAGKDLWDQVEAYQVIWGQILAP